MPGMFCTAVYPGSRAIRPRTIPANRSISNSRSSISRRSEAIRAAYGEGRSSRSNSCVPATPNRSLINTCTPHLASTAWISALQCDRNPTSLARCRTNSRSSLVAGGAIHASGRRPIRNKSAKSEASRTHAGTPGLQRIDGPVPAVGGLQHHLRTLTSPGHHRRQALDVIDDPHALEHLTTLGGPDAHRPATVQIDSNKLLTGIRFHRGPPRPLARHLDTPKHPAGRRRWEREEAPLLHRIRGHMDAAKGPVRTSTGPMRFVLAGQGGAPTRWPHRL